MLLLFTRCIYLVNSYKFLVYQKESFHLHRILYIY